MIALQVALDLPDTVQTLALLESARPDLPGANHLLYVQRPRELARAPAGFFARHPVGAAA